MARPRVLTWHVHGSYLYYLSHAPAEFYILSKPGRGPGYLGRYGHFPWGANVHDMPVEQVRDRDFDCILFQAREHYLCDQYEILSPAQQRLPRIYLEHDPPREHPVDTRHFIDDPNTLLVHVTHFNALMWDSGRTPTRVIRHGVKVPETIRYTGDLARGIVIINHIAQRGRRLGDDVYHRARAEVPLDLIGMAADAVPGGIGEIQHHRLPAFQSHYRFFFNPIRYTSLGLAVCEAMMLGQPVVGLATTEMAATVENGVSGYIGTDVDKLIAQMRGLLGNREEAYWLGRGARQYALQHFNIERFGRDWAETFAHVTGREAKAKESLVV